MTSLDNQESEASHGDLQKGRVSQPAPKIEKQLAEIRIEKASSIT